MDINKLVDLAHAYSDLGWAVQEQLGKVLDYQEGDELNVNPNAVRLIAEWLGRADSAGVEGARDLFDFCTAFAAAAWS